MLADLSKAIVQIFPLPPPEKRRRGLIPPTWFLPVYRPECDADYLLGQLLNSVLLASLLLIVTILLDAHLTTGILVDAAEFQQNKLLLSVIFSRLIGLPIVLLSLLFYLRIRLGIDISRDDIPVGGRKAWILTHSRRKWIQISAVILFVAPLCIVMTHIIVVQVALHYDKPDSLALILLPQAFAVGVVMTGAVYLPWAMLVLEKAVRFFPALQDNVKRNYEYAQRFHRNQ